MSFDRDLVTLDGLLLTGVDEFGVEWITTGLDGWGGSPASTLQPVQKLRAPGAWLSPRQLAPRQLAPTGLCRAPSRSALRDASDRLNAAAAIDGATLAVTEGDLTRTATVYRQDAPLFTPQTDTLAVWSLALVAADPRKYGPQFGGASGVSTGLPTSSGGLTWPVTWPMTWTGVTNAGVIHIDNPGNIESGLVFRIDGPCTGPRITHDVSGGALVFASSYDLAAGSFLVIDMERKTVLEGGQASRNAFITSREWFSLAPGPNDFEFAANVTNTQARLTLTAAPAYL